VLKDLSAISINGMCSVVPEYRQAVNTALVPGCNEADHSAAGNDVVQSEYVSAVVSFFSTAHDNTSSEWNDMVTTLQA
jgi:hypothetical protein